MPKKRKAPRAVENSIKPLSSDRYDPEERFDDSEDEFFAVRDKILLDEEPAAKRRRRIEEQEQDLQPSDEEVYQEPDTELESEAEEDGGHQSGDEEEDERDWGTSKADYYNADVIETEADALEEEQEARRLQQKQLKGMTEADFGFDESAWAAESQRATQKRATVEKLPDLQIPEHATVDERIQILKTRYPEFEPLTQDFLRLQDPYLALKKEAEIVPEGEEERSRKSVALTKFRALSAYLGAVAMYLALLTSSKAGAALPPGDLRGHPVMTNLVQCRQLWQETDSLRPVEASLVLKDKPVEKKQEPTPLSKPSPPAVIKKSKVTRQPALVTLPEALVTEVKPKKSRKPKRNDLQDLLAASMQKPMEAESDFGDEAPLTQEEAAEKARRKKTLRFYTSQIAQKANKRGAASRQAGGDDDVPHKERLRDKQERLMREAEQRGKANPLGNEALDDTDDEDLAAGRRLNDDANEYYDTLVSNARQKKADKRARADAYAEAARQGGPVYEDEQVGADGKRKITYAIEKNKGLAPKRKKEVRNPRVKKRKKYDEKMKKLSSMRPVYKGGEGRGGYGGEATGIKTNLVKSIKL